MSKKLFIVRKRASTGQYISGRVRADKSGKKYAWVNTRGLAVTMSYDTARGVARRYGGEVVSA